MRTKKVLFEWQEKAKCSYDLKWWDQASEKEQKEYCRGTGRGDPGCPVINQCLMFALQIEEDERPPSTQNQQEGWPVYGGMSVAERLLMIKTKRKRQTKLRYEI
jgi:hypothetical protein